MLSVEYVFLTSNLSNLNTERRELTHEHATPMNIVLLLTNGAAQLFDSVALIKVTPSGLKQCLAGSALASEQSCVADEVMRNAAKSKSL